MRILFTGASSFTGYWFVKELARAGHDVVAIFRTGVGEYEGIRAERVGRLAEVCERVEDCIFGDERFLELIEGRSSWDVLCHHAAETTGYKRPEFDARRAVESNTHNLRDVLQALRARECTKVVLTGSAFESNEGAGSEGLPAFSPYGLSKALTAEVFRYYVRAYGLRLGKFVVPNPFGPFEEPRFTAYLVRCWYEGRRAVVENPSYVRDNIHVSLLAKAYVRFVEDLGGGPNWQRLNPSGYPGSQGSFVRLFADALRGRLGLACEADLERQTEFAEPRVRINTDSLDPVSLGWDEDTAWDELAGYYRQTYGGRK